MEQLPYRTKHGRLDVCAPIRESGDGERCDASVIEGAGLRADGLSGQLVHYHLSLA
jgi:hypothetical protein